MERELKLRVSKEHFDALRQAPLLAHLKKAAKRPQLMMSTYFDTPALALHGCKTSLRVRTVGTERVQTLKREGSAQAGLFERDEFEMPIERDVPDLQ